MKQNSGDRKCIAVCAAMAFDSTIKEFEDFINEGAPYSELDFARFALMKNKICGMGINEQYFHQFIHVDDSEGEEIIETQKPIDGNTIITIKFQIKDYPALIIVKSENDETLEHAVYWDGSQIWDPNPNVRNGRPFSEYQILRIYPIFSIEGE